MKFRVFVVYKCTRVLRVCIWTQPKDRQASSASGAVSRGGHASTPFQASANRNCASSLTADAIMVGAKNKKHH